MLPNRENIIRIFLLDLLLIPIILICYPIIFKTVNAYYIPNSRVISFLLFGCYCVFRVGISRLVDINLYVVAEKRFLFVLFSAILAAYLLFLYNMTSVYILFSLIFLYVYYYSNFKINFTVGQLWKIYIAASIALLILFLPLIFDKVINNESFDVYSEDVAESIAGENFFLKVKLNSGIDWSERLKLNYANGTIKERILLLSEYEKLAYIFASNEINDHIALRYDDAKLLCLIIKSDLLRNECYDTLARDPFLINYYSKYIPELYISAPNYSQSLNGSLSNIRYLFAANHSKGYYFHHYNSIARPFFDYATPKFISFINNQYGLGPLSIINIIHNLNYTIFDSIFLATFLTNIFVFLYLLSNYKYYNLSNVLLVYSSGVLLTYSMSGYMAPMLYSIRLLPQFLLLISIFKFSVDRNFDFDKNFSFKVLLLISIFYNTEFGLIFGFIFIFYYIVRKDKFYYIIFSSIVTLFLIKIFGSYSSGHVSVDYLKYFSEVSLLNYYDLLAEVFIVIFVLILVVFLQTEVFYKNNFIYLSILITSGVMVKIFWINASNHMGIVTTFLYFNYLILSNEIKVYNINNKLFYIFTRFLNVFIVSIFFHSIALLVFSKQLDARNSLINYNRDQSISGIFDVSVDLLTVSNDFRSIYNENDLLLSTNDNVLGFLLKRNDLIGPYWDVSSTINSQRSLEEIKNFYYSSNRDIIIQKDIDENSKKTASIISTKGATASTEFDVELAYIRSLSKNFENDSNYHRCAESKYYFKYCKIQNILNKK